MELIPTYEYSTLHVVVVVCDVSTSLDQVKKTQASKSVTEEREKTSKLSWQQPFFLFSSLLLSFPLEAWTDQSISSCPVKVGRRKKRELFSLEMEGGGEESVCQGATMQALLRRSALGWLSKGIFSSSFFLSFFLLGASLSSTCMHACMTVASWIFFFFGRLEEEASYTYCTSSL